jgi:hypothetical protein
MEEYNKRPSLLKNALLSLLKTAWVWLDAGFIRGDKRAKSKFSGKKRELRLTRERKGQCNER